VWKLEQVGERLTKIPYNAQTYHKASSTNPATWATFDLAEKAAANGNGFNGVGFVLKEEGGLVGTDLDKCFDENGNLYDWAEEIVRLLNSYTEVSQSGNGLHIISRGKLPPEGRKRGNIEMYEEGRFLATTGEHWPGTPLTIENRKEEILAVHASVFKPSPVAPVASRVDIAPLSVDDDELIRVACKSNPNFARLWQGDVRGYASHSEADMALATHLAYWTQADHARMDILFRRSDLLKDAARLFKWNAFRGADTYGNITLGKAISGCSQVYEPGRKATVIADVKSRPEKASWADVIRPAPWASARDLMAMNIRPLEWVVPGIIPEGLTIIGGRPKAGKSWGTYGIGVAVSAGGMAFGKIECPQGDVLYLALEDGLRRLQSRMRSLLRGAPVPDAFDYAIKWPQLAAPGMIVSPETPECVNDIEWWLDRHPKARLVIIDTLAKVRRPSKGNGGNAYEEDYEGMTPLQRLATERRIGLMLITHTRKPATGKASSDFLDEIQGSTAITGSADTILGLKKTGDQQVCLMVRGRDVDEQELAIEWDRNTCDWTLLGEVVELRRSDDQKACLQVLRDAGGPLHYRVVAGRIGKGDKVGIASVQSLLWRLSQGGAVVMAGEGFYSAVKGIDHA
jgi:hypothetical protein